MTHSAGPFPIPKEAYCALSYANPVILVNFIIISSFFGPFYCLFTAFYFFPFSPVLFLNSFLSSAFYLNGYIWSSELIAYFNKQCDRVQRYHIAGSQLGATKMTAYLRALTRKIKLKKMEKKENYCEIQNGPH